MTRLSRIQVVKADLLRGHHVSVTEEVTIHLLLSVILLRMDSVCELELCRGELSPLVTILVTITVIWVILALQMLFCPWWRINRRLSWYEFEKYSLRWRPRGGSPTFTSSSVEL